MTSRRLLLEAGAHFGDSDVLVVCAQVISKAEGRTVALSEVKPSEQALELARGTDKDPRTVQVVLDETAVLVRAERGVLICRTPQGFVCANAGVDSSNGAPGTLVLLPHDPDGSAARAARAPARAERRGAGGAHQRLLRARLAKRPAGGRARVRRSCNRSRTGAGAATQTAARSRHLDRARRPIAGAADLARAKDSREPIVIVGGLGRHVSADHGPGAVALIRPPSEDLFA